MAASYRGMDRLDASTKPLFTQGHLPADTQLDYRLKSMNHARSSRICKKYPPRSSTARYRLRIKSYIELQLLSNQQMPRSAKIVAGSSL